MAKQHGPLSLPERNGVLIQAHALHTKQALLNGMDQGTGVPWRVTSRRSDRASHGEIVSETMMHMGQQHNRSPNDLMNLWANPNPAASGEQRCSVEA